MTQNVPKINAKRLKELFRDMVDIYSPSGKEEEITEFLAGYLHEKGLPVTLREVSDGRRNVEVVFSDTRPDIAFIGHIDTVPAFDIEQYGFDQYSGTVSGLGTADMKGGCAAMIEAFIGAVESEQSLESAGLFLVVGEEETGDGTAALLEARSFPWALVAEPTNLVPCLCHYGYMEMVVRAFGMRRHASKAGQEYNAILGMLNTLLALGERFKDAHRDAILNIRGIHSSESGFAVPASCEAWVDLHITPDVDPVLFSKELSNLVKTSLKGSSVTGYEMEFPILAKGYELAQRGLLPKLLKDTYKLLNIDFKPGAFESHSDANLLWQAGCKPVILGPGQLAKAHTSDESVELAQVEKAAQIYRQLLNQL